MIQTPGLRMPYQHFLEGGGEMGKLTRSHDWTLSPMGSPEEWSPNLLSTVSTILNSRFPMFLWWGTDLIQFYNDAYRPSLGINGKHPSALGQCGEECWPEIWPVIKPLIDQVMAGGEATWSEDQLIPIYRNNRLDEVYWTFSYSRVKDGPGMPGGVLVNCFETTEKVLANRQMEKTLKELAENEAQFRYIFADAPVAVGVFAGRELIIESANRKILEVWDKTIDIIGKPLHIAMPELEGQSFLRLLDEVLTSGLAFFGNETKAMVVRQGILTEIYFNFVYHPLKSVTGETTRVMVVATDVSEQVKARKSLERAQDLLSLSIEAAGIGIWTADITTDRLTVSDQARTIHGLPEGTELTLNASAEMILPEYRQQVLDNIKAAIKNKTEFNNEFWIQPGNGGKPRWLKSNGKAYYNENGKALYITGALMDNTELKEDELRKNDFIGMVSHELKTPLTSLTALVQMLQLRANKNEDSFSAGALDKANRQVKKMNTMINGFLNISRLESGKIQIHKTDFNLPELVEELIEELKLTVSHHHIIFEPCETIIVNADRDKIVSVISNLLTNAIKYSPKADLVQVTCRQSDGFIQISVKDEGMGIKTKDQERLFERYYRADNPESQQIAGFGLGLYLSAEIIYRHGGEIWVESEPAKGSTFYFTLPLSS
jgi:two-component system sensor histidine kinase VicK